MGSLRVATAFLVGGAGGLRRARRVDATDGLAPNDALYLVEMLPPVDASAEQPLLAPRLDGGGRASVKRFHRRIHEPRSRDGKIRCLSRRQSAPLLDECIVQEIGLGLIGRDISALPALKSESRQAVPEGQVSQGHAHSPAVSKVPLRAVHAVGKGLQTPALCIVA